MDPIVVLALIGAAVAVMLARGREPAPQREPVPVRTDDDSRSVVRLP